MTGDDNDKAWEGGKNQPSKRLAHATVNLIFFAQQNQMKKCQKPGHSALGKIIFT